MTKSRFAELVLIRVNGGRLNDNSSTDRRDIKAYLPAAVNYAMMAGYNLEIKGEGDRDFSSLFYGYFPQQAVLVDTDRHNWIYIVDPAGGIALPRNQDIRSIEDDLGNTYKPLPDNAMKSLNYYLPLMDGIGFYRREGKKIYLFNAPKLIKHINASRIVDCDSLTDDDLLPIPAGLEKIAMDICYEFITGIRQIPADRKNDKRDLN